MAEAENKQKPDFYHYLQESRSYLGLRLVALQLIIALVAVIINISFASVLQLDDYFFFITGLSLAHGLLQLANAGLVFFLIVSWQRRVYIITPEEVFVQNGVVAVSRTVFKVEKIETINVRQSALGSFLNYGTVAFVTSALKEEVTLDNIPDPLKYASVLENSRMGAKRPTISR